MSQQQCSSLLEWPYETSDLHFLFSFYYYYLFFFFIPPVIIKLKNINFVFYITFTQRYHLLITLLLPNRLRSRSVACTLVPSLSKRARQGGREENPTTQAVTPLLTSRPTSTPRSKATESRNAAGLGMSCVQNVSRYNASLGYLMLIRAATVISNCKWDFVEMLISFLGERIADC